MLKIRFGAVPLTEVNMPLPAVSVLRSSQYGKIVLSWLVHGRQTLVKAVSVVTNWALPFDDRLIIVKLCPYSV